MGEIRKFTIDPGHWETILINGLCPECKKREEIKNEKEKAEKAVQEINDKLFMDCTEKLVESDYFWYLEYVETPVGDYIKYMGQYIWDSENDYREWIDEDNQEPLETLS